MSGYDLTDQQKELLRKLVKCDKEKRLHQPGYLNFSAGDDVFNLDPCGIVLNSLADLDALCDAKLLVREQITPHYRYRITNEARTAVANNFQMQMAELSEDKSAHQYIGTYIQGNVSAGNLVSIGVSNAPISQIVNDPNLLRIEIEAISAKLLAEVKTELRTNDLVEYQKVVDTLKQLLLTPNAPPTHSFKKIIGTLGLLDTTNGSLELVLKIWPLIQILITLVSALPK